MTLIHTAKLYHSGLEVVENRGALASTVLIGYMCGVDLGMPACSAPRHLRSSGVLCVQDTLNCEALLTLMGICVFWKVRSFAYANITSVVRKVQGKYKENVTCG